MWKRKNRWLFLLSFLWLTASSLSMAEEQGTGVGILLGQPTGFTAKFWQNQERAIDAGLSYSFNKFLIVYGDYLFHFPGAFGEYSRFSKELTPYFGIGGSFFVSTDDQRSKKILYTDRGSTIGIGARVPLGVEWIPYDVPVGIFVEFVPGVGIVPETFLFLQGGIGARYYF